MTVRGLRPFTPARDFTRSKSFYQALGFTLGHDDGTIAIFRCDDAGFILQNYYEQAFADNAMHQLLIDDLDAWWDRVAPAEVAERFGARAPVPAAMQSWGMAVAFIWDPMRRVVACYRAAVIRGLQRRDSSSSRPPIATGSASRPGHAVRVWWNW